MKLYTNLKPELIKLNCTAKTTEGVLKELLYLLKLRGKISNEESILMKLMERDWVLLQSVIIRQSPIQS